MSTFVETPPQARLSTQDAKARVDELCERSRRSFHQRVIGHRFNQELFRGDLPRPKFVGFLKNWFSFSFEINTTIAATIDRYLSFFKRHSDCYDLIAEKVADEFIHPGPGGHVKMFHPLADALGLEMTELFHARLITEARALLDVRCRLLLRGPMAEAIATTLGESSIGVWLGLIGKALHEHYGITPEQAIYFSKHFEADTQQHDEHIAPHGQCNAYLLQKLLEDGYQPERPGFDLDYAVDLSVDMYVLFLDGLYRRY